MRGWASHQRLPHVTKKMLLSGANATVQQVPKLDSQEQQHTAAASVARMWPLAALHNLVTSDLRSAAHTKLAVTMKWIVAHRCWPGGGSSVQGLYRGSVSITQSEGGVTRTRMGF